MGDRNDDPVQGGAHGAALDASLLHSGGKECGSQ